MATVPQLYAEALFPDPVRVFGVQLQRYCIGHAMLLQRLGNPLECGSGSVEGWQIGEILEAVYVCSRTWQRAYSGVRSKWTRRLLRWWGWQLRRMSIGKYEFRRFEAEMLLRQYVAEAWTGPDLWEVQQPSGGKTTTIDRLVHLMGIARIELHCDLEGTLSLPLRTALYDAATVSVRNGRSEFVSDEEIALIETAGGAA